ncbi:high mobility group-T protein-like [Uloborus diversus]|uniref:high mobility group-T protein-like n=1 Tax=Uloborus diversus TaxID=327109 RepID=UPI00240A5CF9|nr:high mobility group-T protein-like [Uloborus diversus]
MGIADVAKLFKNAYQISLNFDSNFRTAHAYYATEQLAAQDFEANQNLTIEGQKVFVVYASASKEKSPKRNKKAKKPAAKKMKLEPKVVEDDDDDDDDDDDE